MVVIQHGQNGVNVPSHVIGDLNHVIVSATVQSHHVVAVTVRSLGTQARCNLA